MHCLFKFQSNLKKSKNQILIIILPNFYMILDYLNFSIKNFLGIWDLVEKKKIKNAWSIIVVIGKSVVRLFNFTGTTLHCVEFVLESHWIVWSYKYTQKHRPTFILDLSHSFLTRGLCKFIVNAIRLNLNFFLLYISEIQLVKWINFLFDWLSCYWEENIYSSMFRYSFISVNGIDIWIKSIHLIHFFIQFQLFNHYFALSLERTECRWSFCFNDN